MNGADDRALAIVAAYEARFYGTSIAEALVEIVARIAYRRFDRELGLEAVRASGSRGSSWPR